MPPLLERAAVVPAVSQIEVHPVFHPAGWIRRIDDKRYFSPSR